jgi:hypothetical protein
MNLLFRKVKILRKVYPLQFDRQDEESTVTEGVLYYLPNEKCLANHGRSTSKELLKTYSKDNNHNIATPFSKKFPPPKVLISSSGKLFATKSR